MASAAPSLPSLVLVQDAVDKTFYYPIVHYQFADDPAPGFVLMPGDPAVTGIQIDLSADGRSVAQAHTFSSHFQLTDWAYQSSQQEPLPPQPSSPSLPHHTTVLATLSPNSLAPTNPPNTADQTFHLHSDANGDNSDTSSSKQQQQQRRLSESSSQLQGHEHQPTLQQALPHRRLHSKENDMAHLAQSLMTLETAARTRRTLGQTLLLKGMFAKDQHDPMNQTEAHVAQILSSWEPGAPVGTGSGLPELLGGLEDIARDLFQRNSAVQQLIDAD
ncbi:hypothetical protein H4R35_003727 [Dimargaris xerosporica]|nr:hypothetical protein H4R35_003727 [Dimargaris xerosporica]